MGLVLAFVGFFYRDLPRRGGVAAALAIGGLIALLVLQILGGNVSGRFEVQGLSDEARLETYRSTLRMIVDHPWFGTGLGTFVWSFPAYRSAHMSMWGVWDKAHIHTPRACLRSWVAARLLDRPGLADCFRCADPWGVASAAAI